MKNKTIKLSLHSIVDLITNSSTVIFTYSEGSLDAVKALIDEIIKVFSSDISQYKGLTVDDLFYFGIFLDDVDLYSEYWEDNKDELNDDFKYPEDIEQYIDDILTEKIIKPQWMISTENAEICCEYYKANNSLYIKAKDEQHIELANKLLKYLYSTSHEATRDG